MTIFTKARYLVILAACLSGRPAIQAQEQHVSVDPGTVVRTLGGGIGASWHAMGPEIPLRNEYYDYPVRIVNPRGSGFGGNPPLADTAAWRQLTAHARWLGLDFLRVELSQRMYEPKRNEFDWDNEEMRALYRILDWCEATGADVFLQQMWGDVDWNSWPGVHPLLSAPRSVDDFATGIGELLHHLTFTCKYTCIKYFCITNEPPGGTWGYWWSYGSGSGSVTPAWKKVRETLDARGIGIPLSGPDWTSLPAFDTAKIDFDPWIGAYDIHSYGGIDYEGEAIVFNWANWAHDRGKPFFISEFGNMNLGWGGNHVGPKSFAASLSNASDVVRAANMGADGFNRWSFVNRGDLDGQWQLVRTWDPEKKEHLVTILPEPEAYFGFAMLSRYMGKHARLLFWQTNLCIDGVKLLAFRNKDNSTSLLIVNNELRPIREFVTFEGEAALQPVFTYQVTADRVSVPGYKPVPVPVVRETGKPMIIELPPESITLVTTLRLEADEPGIME